MNAGSPGRATVRQALLPGLFSGLLVVILSVSFAALIFSGPLARYVDRGVSIAMTASIVVGLVTTLFGRIHPTISQADEDCAPVFAVLLSLVVASMPAATAPGEILATALLAIALSTMAAGAGLALLGLLRFGGLIQFLPYSVMSGYFAAVGWLLVTGGFKASVPSGSFGAGGVEELWTALAAWSWAPALLVTACLVLLRRRFSRIVYLLPATAVLACLGWYGAILATGESPQSLMASGLLIGPFGAGGVTLQGPLGGVDPGAVHWRAILTSMGGTGSVFLISTLSLTFSVHGLGLLHHLDPDMNRELKMAGAANILSGLGGGMTGLPSYNLSALSLQMGADRSRLPGLIAAGMCVVVMFWGLVYIAWIPRFLLGGLLMYLGIGLIREWLVNTWHRYSPAEYLVIPLIVVVSIGMGFFKGILAGLVAAIALFVVKYSQTRVIRFTATGSEISSNVDRDGATRAKLEAAGAQTLVFGLEGYLFFGTAGSIYESLKNRLAQVRDSRLNYVIMDFGHVTGIDASAALNFRKVENMAALQDFQLVLAGITEPLLQRLRKGGFGEEHPEALTFLPDLDRALEWVENHVLDDETDSVVQASCFQQLRPYLGSDGDLDQFRRYLEERRVAGGDVLAGEGAESNELLFIETVAASAFIKQPDGKVLRVRTTEQGTVYGELGFYLGIPRTATIRAHGEGLIYILSQSALTRMEAEHPELAAGLHRFMARLLSERLLNTTQTLKAVLL